MKVKAAAVEEEATGSQVWTVCIGDKNYISSSHASFCRLYVIIWPLLTLCFSPDSCHPFCLTCCERLVLWYPASLRTNAEAKSLETLQTPVSFPGLANFRALDRWTLHFGQWLHPQTPTGRGVALPAPDRGGAFSAPVVTRAVRWNRPEQRTVGKRKLFF